MGNDRGAAPNDRERWEDRHRSMLEETSLEPAPLLVDFAGVLSAAPSGRALDVACGNGRNAFLLASLGYEVTAVDFSAPAIEFVGRRAADLGVELTAVESDLSEFEVGVERYAVITSFHFLDRNLVPRIIRGLIPGGYLFFETFTVDEREVLGREMRREYLLERNEALHLFAPLRIVYYREGILKGEGPQDEPRAVARLIGTLPEKAGSPPTLTIESAHD